MRWDPNWSLPIVSGEKTKMQHVPVQSTTPLYVHSLRTYFVRATVYFAGTMRSIILILKRSRHKILNRNVSTLSTPPLHPQPRPPPRQQTVPL